jgi:hypothetical protein
MRIGPRVQPEPEGGALPRVALGVVVGAAAVLLGLLGGPEPEDAARSVAAASSVRSPADVPSVSYWSYRSLRVERDTLRWKLRCLREHYPLGDLGTAIHACGLEPYGPPAPPDPK